MTRNHPLTEISKQEIIQRKQWKIILPKFIYIYTWRIFTLAWKSTGGFGADNNTCKLFSPLSDLCILDFNRSSKSPTIMERASPPMRM